MISGIDGAKWMTRPLARGAYQLVLTFNRSQSVVEGTNVKQSKTSAAWRN